MSNEDRAVLTAGKVAQILGVSVTVVMDDIKKGRIASTILRNGTPKYLFTTDDVREGARLVQAYRAFELLDLVDERLDAADDLIQENGTRWDSVERVERPNKDRQTTWMRQGGVQ